jgi:hypothetical protein
VPVGALATPFTNFAIVATVNGSTSFPFPMQTTSNAPVVAAGSPTSGPVGTQVALTGVNLTRATITFFGPSASPIVIAPQTNTATQIVTTVPGGAISGPLITTPNGSFQAPFKVTPDGLPTVTSVMPTSGPVGTSVTKEKGTADWTQLSVTFTAPANTVGGRVDVLWDFKAGDRAWFDDV